MTFRLYPLCFQFIALDAIHFPAAVPANILRGALGHIFRRVAGDEQYARFFAPAANGPSGLRDSPRPFVFRAAHLDDKTVAAGESFHFGLNVFQVVNPPIHHLIESFSLLVKRGLGPSRSRVELINTPKSDLLELPLTSEPRQVTQIHVRFVTPTEIKSGSALSQQPEFPVLIARVRDRLSTLRAIYDNGPLDIDFKQFADRAAHVQMVRCQLQQTSIERRSSRTGQTHPLGGFTGEAEYAGDLAEFLPYLNAAQWTGVGRQASWGKGELHVTVLK